MHLKMLSAKSQPFCFGLNVFKSFSKVVLLSIGVVEQVHEIQEPHQEATDIFGSGMIRDHINYTHHTCVAMPCTGT